ncbi:LLM class F420-dependent oxidoreductase [Ktedonosporobacter rubrisoli]|uniref:LLM class F420-dependent oxidoreductase n=1 Tax=Ktedonosporobacter rubrisoli TaxID=2509675 RepID=A0A4P6JN35_KTERU|nr:LLM class F420-dependent oxidoreductase [Ktedonosporobacter rubrisoli]QBD76699.1 LLM class F420-dependent oxidoreductase [Ktedonosporobacter rubrisoli]
MANSQTTHPLQVGVQLHPQHTTYQSFAEAVQRVEKIGVDSIWNWDHFFPLYGDPQGSHFEGWTLLTAMATLTTRAQIGCLVSCNTYRNPALLADMAKTVDHISNGRLILGIGAGWFERDYREYGYDFGTPGSRLKALEEAIPTILHRWEVDAPKPVRYSIPILIGGGGEKKTLYITAKYANIWHGFGDVATLAHKNQVLDQWCKEVGRNPNEIIRSTAIRTDFSEHELDDKVATGISFFTLELDEPWDYSAVERLVKWRDGRQLATR